MDSRGSPVTQTTPSTAVSRGSTPATPTATTPPANTATLTVTGIGTGGTQQHGHSSSINIIVEMGGIVLKVK